MLSSLLTARMNLALQCASHFFGLWSNVYGLACPTGHALPPPIMHPKGCKWIVQYVLNDTLITPKSQSKDDKSFLLDGESRACGMSRL